ncbi:MAG: undecaprenyldiphospho-muramoylpentapeptide beta-N-acetylglucosaminyltransferase [Calditrichaeota bacterium]|nr:undecaprenyldiphospho-muramoylpentapeptide beta-N-acetylglucosaminyltransferase [Calditrichota bacterium]RQV99712.1 MAG: undecaprenyldiphospho-muramoylpentapeptide beta-N-acetylglucosaminyltransferase [Calditrichota bacterium]
MKPLAGKIIFAGGGTGGHVYPALAILQTLKEKGAFSFLYVGGTRGIENSIIPREGIPFRTIWISGFQRYFTLKNLLFPLKLVISLFQSLFILLKSKPAVVVGTGGYVSGPVVYCASKLGIPILIQEQDSFPGVTTRWLSRYADVICVPYQDVKQHLPRAKGEIVVSGVPVRRSLTIVEKGTVADFWGFKPDRPVLLVFGGSQGARSLNRALIKIGSELLHQTDIQILWQTGEKNFDEVANHPVSHQEGIVLREYIKDMDKAYSVADIIISRAGAVTLAELALVAKPCILVPYPAAAAGHQEKNAKSIAQKGAAFVITEKENFQTEILDSIKKLLQDKNLAENMGRRWKEIARPDAADVIADQILKLMKEKHEDTARKN